MTKASGRRVDLLVPSAEYSPDAQGSQLSPCEFGFSPAGLSFRKK